MEISPLEKRIVALIAEHTIDTETDYETLYDVDLPEHHHTFFEDGLISYHVLYNKYNERFRETKDDIDRASFNNALRSLCEEKDIVVGVALAWVSVNDGKILKWLQRRDKENSSKGKPHYDTKPAYKLVGLTTEGWEIAKKHHGAFIGICERMRRVLQETDKF